MGDPIAVGPLAGVRVLDLADESGVLAAKLLADLGADALRIEPPDGDPIRRLGPFVSSESLSHWWFNAGKRLAVLDLATIAGRERVAALAEGADIVIETGHHGLDFAAIRAAQPSLTVVSVTPFGRSGPRRDWLSSDLIAWATGGAMYSTGWPDRQPLRTNWALATQIAGLFAAIGGLAGLCQARATGRGAHFDLSRQEAVAALLAAHVPVYVCDGGRIESRVGLGNPMIAPFRDFATRDGVVMFLAVTQGQWNTLVEWVIETEDDVEPWIVDPDLAPLVARRPHRDRIHAFLTRWIARFTTDEFVREANRRRIPCGPINRPRDVLRDEQLRARGFFVEVDQPILGRRIEYPGLPYPIEGAAIRPAPTFGVSGVGSWVPEDKGQAAGEAPPRAEWLPRPGAHSSSPFPSRDGSSGSSEMSGVGSAGTTPQVVGGGSPSPDNRHPIPSPGPLAGLRILDFTWALAGPTGVRTLADLGADVIKVEPRGTGDVMRTIPPFWGGRPDPNRSGLFFRLNYNRRSVCVDLKKPEGVALVRRLAARADLAIDNYGAGVMDRLGIGWGDLSAAKPDLIQISLSGYGQQGPSRHYPSFAPVSEARTGLTYAASYADGTVAGPNTWIGDTGAGLQLAVIALAAVERRRRTGQGAYVDMSQLEAAAMLLGPALLDAIVNDRSFVPQGNLLPDRDAAPHEAYPAAGEDRWVTIAVLDEAQWQALIKVMNRSDLAADGRFATAADRVAHVAELDAVIGAWTRDQEPHRLVERLQAGGVPAGVVQTSRDLLEDPHLRARGFFQTVDQPEVGPIPVDSCPLRWTADPVPVRYPAPLLGEHTEYVLREVLGLSEQEVVALIVDEVV
ncbi:MAG TPA: CoA transferase [Dehalococcoidia bacterium]|nr:CoA transferase [Dehalococcoidia bacterium]